MLNRLEAVLVIVDIQEKLFRVMKRQESLIGNTIKLIQGFQALDIPILVTEQIPAKIGPTIPEISEKLAGVSPVAKESFSCWGEPAFRSRLESLNRRQVVLTGIECHVCVYQTALDLMANGYSVHPVTDTVSSRTSANRKIGLSSMKSAGAHLTSTEMVLFELLRTAACPQARNIFKIVK
jgi:nicotinamidase-related amidase